MMKNKIKIIVLLMLSVSTLMTTACSIMDSEPVAVSSGYYRGHYGQSGWNDNIGNKRYTGAHPVFTGATSH